MLLEEAKRALSEKNVNSLCKIATESTLLWQKVNPKSQLDIVIKFMSETSGLGVVNTHSGTYLGVLYRDGTTGLTEVLRRAEAALPGCAIQLFETVSCVTNSLEMDHQ